MNRPVMNIDTAAESVMDQYPHFFTREERVRMLAIKKLRAMLKDDHADNVWGTPNEQRLYNAIIQKDNCEVGRIIVENAWKDYPQFYAEADREIAQ